MQPCLAAAALALTGDPALAADNDSDLAKKLSNPISSLISVPFQFNYDQGYGPEDGEKLLLNVQPVVPISLSENWNLISRTIVPIAWQDDIAGRSGKQFGLGDVLQSGFFSPKAPLQTAVGNLTWGVGPVLSLPTSTDDLLGSGKFGLGPTGVALVQEGPWTYGALANHVWSVSGRDKVSATFLQPFLTHTSSSAWTIGVNSESSYNWKADQWSVPINVFVAKLVNIQDQKVQFLVNGRYWAESPDAGPDSFGVRAQITLLFPD
ncbi:transporter [Pikeienuella piscinae]|uniref:Transporter n=1 Tax=Pikeienuella piscinae TaxID=2748098 RepID=A0A7M3T701_9RHOB|nr:transporter [Pikeienuella piscinae]